MNIKGSLTYVNSFYKSNWFDWICNNAYTRGKKIAAKRNCKEKLHFWSFMHWSREYWMQSSHSSKIIPSQNAIEIMLIIPSTLIQFSTERSSHRYFRIGHNQLNRFNRTFFGLYRKWLILCAPYTPFTSTYIVQLLCSTHNKRSFHKYTPNECDCTYWIYIEIISACFNQ